MQYQINAWLEKIHPAIQIIDRNNNQTVREFNERELQEMIETGDLIPSDLYSANSTKLSLLVEELLSRYYQPEANRMRTNQQSSQAHTRLLTLIEKAKRF